MRPLSEKIKAIAAAISLKPGSKWVGKAYRSDTGYKHGKGQTALSVVKYEADELGNDDILTQAKESGVDLSRYPASSLKWIGRLKGDVKKYGNPEEIEVPEGSVVIAADGDGGYLVLFKKT